MAAKFPGSIARPGFFAKASMQPDSNEQDYQPFKAWLKTATKGQIDDVEKLIQKERESRRSWFARHWPLLVMTVVWLMFSPWTIAVSFDDAGEA